MILPVAVAMITSDLAPIPSNFATSATTRVVASSAALVATVVLGVQTTSSLHSNWQSELVLTTLENLPWVKSLNLKALN